MNYKIENKNYCLEIKFRINSDLKSISSVTIHHKSFPIRVPSRDSRTKKLVHGPDETSVFVFGPRTASLVFCLRLVARIFWKILSGVCLLSRRCCPVFVPILCPVSVCPDSACPDSGCCLDSVRPALNETPLSELTVSLSANVCSRCHFELS